MSADLIGILGFVAGVISIIYAHITLRRARATKWLYYCVATRTLVSEGSAAVPELATTFRGETIANLRVSLIALWNAGDTAINETDASIAVVCRPSQRLLKVERIFSDEGAVEIEVAPAHDKKIPLDVKCIERNRGALFRVLFYGSDENPDLYGYVKDNGGPRRKIFIGEQLLDFLPLYVFLLVIVMSLLLFITASMFSGIDKAPAVWFLIAEYLIMFLSIALLIFCRRARARLAILRMLKRFGYSESAIEFVRRQKIEGDFFAMTRELSKAERVRENPDELTARSG